MNAQLVEFFGWTSVIHIALLCFMSVMMLMIRDFAAGVHARMFGLDLGAVRLTFYQILGLYKIGIILFSVIPWVVLRFLI